MSFLPTPGVPGTHRSYVLTDEQADGIRRLYRAGKGVTERELARIAGVHETTISDIITGKIHKQEPEQTP